LEKPIRRAELPVGRLLPDADAMAAHRRVSDPMLTATNGSKGNPKLIGVVSLP